MKKRLSLIQMDVHVNEVEYNYARVQELLSQALSESPDIIILPETWNTGFHPSKDLINISDRNGERTKDLLSTFAKGTQCKHCGRFCSRSKRGFNI